jgi:hypothetical protein
MDTHSPYPFRSTSGVIRQQVSVAWGQAGLGGKLIACIITLSLLIFLLFVVVPLAILLMVIALGAALWSRLSRAIRSQLPHKPSRDSQGRRNVRVLDRNR